MKGRWKAVEEENSVMMKLGMPMWNVDDSHKFGSRSRSSRSVWPLLHSHRSRCNRQHLLPILSGCLSPHRTAVELQVCRRCLQQVLGQFVRPRCAQYE
ncbi:hypothetical protein MPTK1_1g08800 [Marchantia polymorpha subsp. ruderalis]